MIPREVKRGWASGLAVIFLYQRAIQIFQGDICTSFWVLSGGFFIWAQEVDQMARSVGCG